MIPVPVLDYLHMRGPAFVGEVTPGGHVVRRGQLYGRGGAVGLHRLRHGESHVVLKGQFFRQGGDAAAVARSVWPDERDRVRVVRVDWCAQFESWEGFGTWVYDRTGGRVALPESELRVAFDVEPERYMGERSALRRVFLHEAARAVRGGLPVGRVAGEWADHSNRTGASVELGPPKDDPAALRKSAWMVRCYWRDRPWGTGFPRIEAELKKTFSSVGVDLALQGSRTEVCQWFGLDATAAPAELVHPGGALGRRQNSPDMCLRQAEGMVRGVLARAGHPEATPRVNALLAQLRASVLSLVTNPPPSSSPPPGEA